MLPDINGLFSIKSGSQRFHYALILIYKKYLPTHCFIAHFSENKTSSVLHHLKNGVIANNFSYSLTNTPSQEAVNKNRDFCTFNNVQHLFPKDVDLVNWDIDGYIGIILRSFEQEPVGILVCLFENSIDTLNIDQYWLKKLANIVGSELSHQIELTNYKNLSKQLNLANVAFNHASDAILISDKNNRIISVNNALEKITGYQTSELIGQNPNIFSSGQHDTYFYAQMWKSLKQHGQWKGEVFNKRKNNEVYPEELALNTVRDKNGEICNYIAIFRDISQWKASEKKLKFYANNEPLTGLYNRRYFYHQIEQQISHAHRNNEYFSIAMLNIDRFSEINNIHGQAIGDKLLKKIARRLNKIIRVEDSICRYDGDEFCILLPNTNAKGTEIVCQKIQKKLHIPFIIGNLCLIITTSIGIAQYSMSGKDATALLRNAGYALQHIKENGRDGITFHNETLQAHYLKKIIIKEKLKNALNQQKLQVYYQPIIELTHQKITKFEALVRWQDEDSFISPEIFIPIAEEYDLIHLVGQFVLEQACTELKKLHNLGFNNISFSINRSICEFQQNTSENKAIDKIISAAGLPHSAIVIEITESVAMSASSATSNIISSLKEKGIKIALDDFCTGFSSLSYLIEYNADFIKIDKSFIDKIVTDKNSQILISTLIILANKLNMCVIAEGVETVEQQQLLAEYGCHFIQGYYYSPAVPFDACLAKLQQQLNCHSQIKSTNESNIQLNG